MFKLPNLLKLFKMTRYGTIIKLNQQSHVGQNQYLYLDKFFTKLLNTRK